MVSSIASELTVPGLSLYGGTKAYVSHFTKHLAAEVHKIDFLNYTPSYVSTDLAENMP
jgi:short-subunit dehydrogenase